MDAIELLRQVVPSLTSPFSMVVRIKERFVRSLYATLIEKMKFQWHDKVSKRNAV